MQAFRVVWSDSIVLHLLESHLVVRVVGMEVVAEYVPVQEEEVGSVMQLSRAVQVDESHLVEERVVQVDESHLLDSVLGIEVDSL